MWHPSLHKNTCKDDIHSFFAHFLHTVPFASLSFLWVDVDILMVFICSCYKPHVQCLFFLLKIQQQILLQSQTESQDEHTTFKFVLLKSYNTKWRHSTCWFSQNTTRYTSMLWLREGQHQTHVQLIMMIYTIHVCYTVECFVADLLGSHYNQTSSLCEQWFLALNLY